jgi:hypothetical protein
MGAVFLLLSSKRVLEPFGLRTSGLAEFLVTTLKGSSLQVKVGEDAREVVLSSPDNLLEIAARSDGEAKKIEYTVRSPALKRRVRVEELGGFDYMESGVEDELRQLKLDMTADDALLAIDLIRTWAGENKYQLTEGDVEESEQSSSPATKPPSARAAGRPRKSAMNNSAT